MAFLKRRNPRGLASVEAKPRWRVLIFIAFSFTLSVPAFTHAYSIGIAVEPSELAISVRENSETTAEFRVKNPSREVAIFEVYPENFENSVVPIPGRFTLESSEERKVTIKILKGQTGAFVTNIAIVARPISDPIIGVGSGIKIPLRVSIKETPKNGLLAMASETALPAIGIAIAAALLGSAVTIFLNRRKTSAKLP